MTSDKTVVEWYSRCPSCHSTYGAENNCQNDSIFCTLHDSNHDIRSSVMMW